MSDIEELSEEDLYERNLIEAGKIKPEDAQEAAPEPEPEEASAEPEKAAEAPQETKAEVAAAEEFFPGYSTLSDEAKAFIREKKEAADRVAEFQQLAGKAEADRRAIHERLAPMQREYEALRTKLKEHEAKKTDISRSSAKQALDKFKAAYPDEAEALEAMNAQFEDYAKKTDEEKAELVERVNALTDAFERQQKSVEADRIYNTELQKLRTIHPDHADIAADPEFDLWLKAIEPAKRSFYDAYSGNAEVVSSFLSDFKRDRELARFYSGAPATPDTPASKPLARTVADPNPTARRTTAIPRSNSSAGLDGEERYLAELREAGIDV